MQLHGSRIRVPQLSFFSCQAESDVQSFIVIISIVDVVEISIWQLAMNEQHVGVRFGFGVVEVGSDSHRAEGLCKIFVPMHSALAQGTAASRAP